MKNNYTLLFIVILCFLFPANSFAQYPQGGGQRGNMNVGHFYGKVLDAKNNKPIELATVQLSGNRFDTSKKRMISGIIKTVLTEPNGDFSLENLPVMGDFILKISAVGFKPDSQKVTFGLKFQKITTIITLTSRIGCSK
jgi:hypothetical protein